MTPHLSDDDLIRRLYGIGEEDDHLAACSECSDRWLAIQNVIRSARAEQPRAPEMTGRKLAVQRQQILAKLDQPLAGSLLWRWVPPAAAASLLAAALFLSRPTDPVTPTRNCSRMCIRWSKTWSLAQPLRFAVCSKRPPLSPHRSQPNNDYPKMDAMPDSGRRTGAPRTRIARRIFPLVG
jgi:hypothetical protein